MGLKAIWHKNVQFFICVLYPKIVVLFRYCFILTLLPILQMQKGNFMRITRSMWNQRNDTKSPI